MIPSKIPTLAYEEGLNSFFLVSALVELEKKGKLENRVKAADIHKEFGLIITLASN